MAQVDNEDRFDVDSQLDQTQTKQKTSHAGSIWTRWWVWLIIILILAIGGYGYATDFSFSGLKNATSEGSSGAVAVVNGEEISQEEFNARIAQAKLNNPNGEVDEAELIETMINTELILQDASSQGITVSDEEVESYYQNQVLTGGTTEEQLKQRLSQSDFTIADLKNDIHDQLVIQKYIEANASAQDISDEDAQNYYDQLKAQQGENTENFPAFADVEAQIKQQLQTQGQNQVIQQIIAQLRADADIVNNYSADSSQ